MDPSNTCISLGTGFDEKSVYFFIFSYIALQDGGDFWWFSNHLSRGKRFYSLVRWSSFGMYFFALWYDEILVSGLRRFGRSVSGPEGGSCRYFCPYYSVVRSDTLMKGKISPLLDGRPRRSHNTIYCFIFHIIFGGGWSFCKMFVGY